MNCPSCSSPKLAGMTECACGHHFPEEEGGRPCLTEMTALPRACRSNGGTAMLLGLAMALGGGGLAHRAYSEDAPRADVRYLIGYCTLGAGLLSLRRGYDRSND